MVATILVLWLGKGISQGALLESLRLAGRGEDRTPPTARGVEAFGVRGEEFDGDVDEAGLAVDRDAAFQHQPFGLTAGGDSSAGQEFLKVETTIAVISLPTNRLMMAVSGLSKAPTGAWKAGALRAFRLI